jgi:Tfp pilus assembly pilus retraction ATPase PilT
VLIKNLAVANLIRENELFQIPSVMQMWVREWMQLLENDLISYIQKWIITEEEWYKYSNNPKLIKERE